MLEVALDPRLIPRPGLTTQQSCRQGPKKPQCSIAGLPRTGHGVGSCPTGSSIPPTVATNPRSAIIFLSPPALSMAVQGDLLRRKLVPTIFAARHGGTKGKGSNDPHHPAGLLLRRPRSRYGSE